MLQNEYNPQNQQHVISERLDDTPSIFSHNICLRPERPSQTAIIAKMPPESSSNERNNMDAEASEDSPLLSNNNTQSRESNETSGARRLTCSPGGLITITLVIALIAVAEAGSILQLVPLNQILEKIICEIARQPASTCGEKQ
jgi:hypothetical protein